VEFGWIGFQLTWSTMNRRLALAAVAAARSFSCCVASCSFSCRTCAATQPREREALHCQPRGKWRKANSGDLTPTHPETTPGLLAIYAQEPNSPQPQPTALIHSVLAVQLTSNPSQPKAPEGL
jgi:hypothetical protein